MSSIIINLTSKSKFSLLQDVKLPCELPCEEVSDRVILDLSRKLPRWQFTARALDLEKSDIESIMIDYHRCREQSYQMLLMWKQRQPENANYQVLGRAIMKENHEVYRKYIKIVSSHLKL